MYRRTSLEIAAKSGLDSDVFVYKLQASRILQPGRLFTVQPASVSVGASQKLIWDPYGFMFHEICASNLIKVDFDGNVIDGDHPFNEAGHAIHSAMLKARPDVNVALHSHTRAGMAVSCMDCGLLPLTQQSNEIRDLLVYHDYGIARTDGEECRRLGADIADKWIMIMETHGLLTVGSSVAEAFYYLYTVENACKAPSLACCANSAIAY